MLAYRWFLDRAAGGDVLVLTADEAPCDIYNSFLYNMSGSTQPNSVTTACFTARSGSNSTKLQQLLAHASGIFVTGGDQSKYLDFWKDTPIAAALSSGRAVVGGSSAGLAIQGQFVFNALHGSVGSEDALKYPTDSEVSLSRRLFDVNSPWMHGVITDTHFRQRDRMGRLVTFVARIAEAGWAAGGVHRGAVLGVGISEHTAILVEHTDGSSSIVGDGPVHFVSSGGRSPGTCREGKPLSWAAPGVDVWRWNASCTGVGWSFGNWTHDGFKKCGAQYNILVNKGKLESSLPGGGIY